MYLVYLFSFRWHALKELFGWVSHDPPPKSHKEDVCMLLLICLTCTGDLTHPQGSRNQCWETEGPVRVWIANKQNVRDEGWAFGTVVKMLLGKPSSCARVPGSRSLLLFWSSFLLIRILGGRRWWLKYVGPCPPHGKPALSSGLLTSAWPSPGHTGTWGISQWMEDLSISFSLLPSLSAFSMETNKQKS